MKTQQDYIYCDDCEAYVDFWKYDHFIEDAGHANCSWRHVSEQELKRCIEDCEHNGCFHEVIL